MRLNIFLALLAAIFFLSCEGDKDEIPPTISFLLPAENASFLVESVVNVRASISDNEKLESISLSLINAGTQQQVLSTVSLRPGTKNVELDVNFSLSDTLLPSGEYYFKIQAEDGRNSFSSFRFIEIQGIPKRKLATLIFTQDGDNTQLLIDNNDLQFINLTTFSNGYQSSTVSSTNQHLWFLPDDDDQLSVYDLKKNQIVFNDQLNSSNTRTFGQILRSETNVYLTTTNGEVQGYNKLFSDNFTYQRENDEFGEMAANEKYLMVLEKNLNGNYRANTLFKNSGALKSFFQIDKQTVAIFFSETEKAIAFQNDVNGGRISELSIEGTVVRRIRTFADSITAVEQINETDYLISTKSAIKLYELDRDNLVDYLNLSEAKVRYDEFTNQLFIANGNQLRVYANGSLNPTATATLPSVIEEIEFRYNYD